MKKRKDQFRQFFRGIRMAMQQRIKEERILMTVGKYPRLIITLLIYVGELLLLLYSIQILAKDDFGLASFPNLTRFGPVKWFLDLLHTVPFVQSVNEAAMEVATAPLDDVAAGELIGAIGVGGIFITLLTGAEEQRICGIRTGELLSWLHTHFFLFYVLLFLPLVSVGIYAGHAKMRKAAVYAFLGVFLGLLLTLWACFELVLNANWRERLALQYYNRQLHPGLVRRLYVFLCHKIGFGKEPTECNNAQRTMISVAGYLRNQAEEYHRNVSAEVVLLWIRSCWIPLGTDMDCPDCSPPDDDSVMRFPAGIKKEGYSISAGNDGKDRFNYVDEGLHFHYPNYYLSDGQDYIITYAIFAGNVWSALLPGEILTEQDLIITRQILHSLYYVSKPDKRRFIVLLGLLFCLEDKAPDDDVQLIKWVDSITKEVAVNNYRDYVPREVRSNLAWALLMIRIIAWIRNGITTNPRESADQFCQSFGAELFQYGETEAAYDRWEATLLWYAEWAARKRCGLSLNRYLLGISTMFGAENLFPHFRQDILTYRKRFLMQILSSIYPWRDIQDKKGAEQE